MARNFPSSPSLEISDEKISDTTPKLTPTVQANLSSGLVEAEKVSVSPADNRMRENIEDVKVEDDLIEVEGKEPISSQVRVSLGPLDQNIVKELTVESVANMKTGK